jgi:hypothetical protein
MAHPRLTGNDSLRFTAALMALAALATATELTAQTAKPSAAAMTLSLAGTDYLHRWSKGGQHEFTPNGQEDLSKWDTMLTLNVHESARTGDQLADLANRLVGNYQRAGTILRTDSKPRTERAEAEHFVAAILISRDFLEAAFARVLLADGEGLIVVHSKRVYGTKAGNEMSAWLAKNGPEAERALLAWTGLPAMARLKALR